MGGGVEDSVELSRVFFAAFAACSSRLRLSDLASGSGDGESDGALGTTTGITRVTTVDVVDALGLDLSHEVN